MRRVVGCALAVALFASALLAPSAGAKVRYPRLDPSFGSGGYVAVPGLPPAAGGEPTTLVGFGATRSGAAYATEARPVPNTCRDRCLVDALLVRVNANGGVASTFGGAGQVAVAGGVEVVAAPIADLEGRAIVATLNGTAVTVRRYLADGSVDSSFGSGGATSIQLGGGNPRYRELQLALDGEGRIVVAANAPQWFKSEPAASGALARLLPGGALDGGFGSGGVVQLAALVPASGITFGSNDAIYLGGSVENKPYLNRISAKGRIDTEFNARANRTLANVSARGALELRSMVLVPRPGGLIDLFGGDGMLRLKSNGKAEPKFGEGGVKLLGWSIIAATLVGHGKVLGLGASSEGVSLIRLKPSGKPDRSFGSEGAALIEGVGEGEGLALAWLSGRRTMVLDLGRSWCRYECPSKPSLIRYRIGPKQG